MAKYKQMLTVDSTIVHTPLPFPHLCDCERSVTHDYDSAKVISDPLKKVLR